MDLNILKREIEYFEGRKSTVYLDTLGLPTVGIGHMDKSMKVGTKYTNAQIDNFFNTDIQSAIAIASKCINNYDTLDALRQRLLVNLAFNLGNRLLDFKKTLAFIQNRDFVNAANELKNSKWYTQVGNRGPAIVYALLNGKWEKVI